MSYFSHDLDYRRVDYNYIKSILRSTTSEEIICINLAKRWAKNDALTAEWKEKAHKAEIKQLEHDIQQAINDKHKMNIRSHLLVAVVSAVLTLSACMGFYQ